MDYFRQTIYINTLNEIAMSQRSNLGQVDNSCKVTILTDIIEYLYLKECDILTIGGLKANNKLIIYKNK